MMHGEQTHELDRLVTLFRALADPVRLRILGAIVEQPKTGRELSDALGLTPPTISHHIAKLNEAGLIQVTEDGTRHYYALDQQALRTVHHENGLSQSNDQTSSVSEDRVRAKILDDFFVDGRLKSIPSQRKKRVVILQYLVDRFEPGRRYQEKEVNAILSTAHEDFATLRRELIDYGFMKRDHGIYEVAQAPPERSKQVSQEFIGDESAWFQQLVSSATERALRSKS